MKTIGIVGSRRRCTEDDFQKCEDKFLSIYEEGDKIVSGGCPRGGDNFAEIIAKKLGLTIIIHYAKWKPDGKNVDKAAGFKRNTFIADDADVLIALVAEDRTGGTEDTIAKAKYKDKEIILL